MCRSTTTAKVMSWWHKRFAGFQKGPTRPGAIRRLMGWRGESDMLFVMSAATLIQEIDIVVYIINPIVGD